VAWLKPTATMGEKPSRAKRRNACSRWASFWGSKSRYSTPVSFLKRSAPAKTPFVEGLVELAAEIVHDGGLHRGGGGLGGGRGGRERGREPGERRTQIVSFM
jgi:hypothetical protein